MKGTPWLMAMLLYGAGLRLMECCRLRVKDIDFSSNQIIVRAAKGDKDRHTMLPVAIKEPLLRHLKVTRYQHDEDRKKGLGRVSLPNALERKYPNAGREWAWQWVFPATGHFTDHITGEKRRHHLHESVVQKAVKEARLNAGIYKPAGCHTFSQCFDIVTTCSISLILSATLVVRRQLVEIFFSYALFESLFLQPLTPGLSLR